MSNNAPAENLNEFFFFLYFSRNGGKKSAYWISTSKRWKINCNGKKNSHLIASLNALCTIHHSNERCVLNVITRPYASILYTNGNEPKWWFSVRSYNTSLPKHNPHQFFSFDKFITKMLCKRNISSTEMFMQMSWITILIAYFYCLCSIKAMFY